jgi:hypothetical protein
MSKKRSTTYENEALGVLTYEFPSSDKAEAEAKIRGRLKRKRLGPYDSERINLLRRLKDELQEEISKFDKSDYFTYSHDYYCDMRDFDIPRLTKEMIERYPQIPKEEIESFVPFCVFNYYLR